MKEPFLQIYLGEEDLIVPLNWIDMEGKHFEKSPHYQHYSNIHALTNDDALFRGGYKSKGWQKSIFRT